MFGFPFPGLFPSQDLLLVRHGHHGKFEETGVDSSEWPLNEAGIQQAEFAGAWIRERYQGLIDRCLVGDFKRMRQSAQHLRLFPLPPPAFIGESEESRKERAPQMWEVKNWFRPRSRGRGDRFPGSTAVHPIHSAADASQDAGESVAQLRDRSQRLLDSIYRLGWRTRVVVAVCARESIWATESLLRGWLDKHLIRLLDPAQRSEAEDILPGEIIQFSCWSPDSKVRPSKNEGWLRRGMRELSWRLNCGKPGIDHRSTSYSWYRRIAPMNSARNIDWQPVKRRRYADHEL